MKCLFVSLSFLFVTLAAQSQLNKGIWLTGGSGSFSATKNTYASTYSGSTYSQSSDDVDIKVSPNIGYLFVDKLAGGLKFSYSKHKVEVDPPGGGNTNVNRYEFGPFVRYYFLESDRQFNLLSEVSYQYGLYRFKPSKGNINTFSAFAGPVIFFNSSVGLEFLIGYYKRNEHVVEGYKTTDKGFQMSLGFQIHLEK